VKFLNAVTERALPEQQRAEQQRAAAERAALAERPPQAARAAT
jgi:hypothetical protein